MSVLAANGTEISIIGQATLHFTLVGRPFSVDFLVSDDVADFMIGMDWMSKVNALWATGGGYLVVNGNKIPLHRRSARATGRHVRVSEVTIVPLVPRVMHRLNLRIIHS